MQAESEVQAAPKKSFLRRFLGLWAAGFAVTMIVSIARGGCVGGGSEDQFELFVKELRGRYSAGPEAETYIAIAKHLHFEVYRKAWSESPRGTRGRRRFSVKAYQQLMVQALNREVELLQRSPEPVSEDFLTGNLWERTSPTVRTIFELLPGGAYRQKFAHPEDYAYQGGDDSQGTWRLDGDQLTWFAEEGQPDENPVLMCSQRGLVLLEEEGHCTYWVRRDLSFRNPFSPRY